MRPYQDKSGNSWRYFVRKHERLRQEKFPFSMRQPDAVKRCPVHNRPLGNVTRTCIRCHDESWEWMASEFTAWLNRKNEKRKGWKPIGLTVIDPLVVAAQSDVR